MKDGRLVNVNYFPVFCIIIFTFIAAQLCSSETIPTFKMGDFIINVDVSTVTVNGVRLLRGQWPTPNSDDVRLNKKYSGKGSFLMQHQTILVNFTDVSFQYNMLRGASLKAKDGVVFGTEDKAIIYSIKSANISIARNSIRLFPTTDTANIVVSIGIGLFSETPYKQLSFVSGKCSFATDGSFWGTTFKSNTDEIFNLSKSKFILSVSRIGFLNDTIYLGESLPYTLSLKQGIYFHGTGTKDLSYIFRCKYIPHTSVTQLDGKALVDIFLSKSETKYPEGYTLFLKTGLEHYEYSFGKLDQYSGSYVTDITFPKSIRKTPSQGGTPIKISDVTLNVNQKDTLFGRILILDTIVTNTVFSFDLSNDSAWVFFPIWHNANPNQSSYGLDTCSILLKTIEGFSNYRGRPGVTLEEGIAMMHLLQIDYINNPYPTNYYNLKTRFSGKITLLKSGLIGDFNSLSNSLIPSNEVITNIQDQKKAKRYSIDEIVRALDARPTEPTARFFLSKLQILEMNIRNVQLCNNNLISSLFYYTSHFPFPSVIDLTFADATLTSDGRFIQSWGPVPTNYTPTGVPTNYTISGILNNKGSKDPQYQNPNPDTHVLWAWRLPISFCDSGITIKFSPSNLKKIDTIKVILYKNRFNPVNTEEIVSSEMWLTPIYSWKSYIKKGIRFEGFFFVNGDFRISDYDQFAQFGKGYTDFSERLKVGFDIIIDKSRKFGIVLADHNIQPSRRTVDVTWTGRIVFPFFGKIYLATSIYSQPNYYLYPTITFDEPQMSHMGPKISCNDDGIENIHLPPTEEITITVNNLKFDPARFYFFSHDVHVINRIEPNPLPGIIKVTKIQITSFIDAFLFKKIDPADLQILVLPQLNNSDEELCTTLRPNSYHSILKNARSSNTIIDLVCYDTDALVVRNHIVTGLCCKIYWMGDYQLIRVKNAQDTLVLVDIPHAIYYPTPQKLVVTSSKMQVKSEVNSNPIPLIDIAGANLTITGNEICGDIGVSSTPVADDLPYEGRMLFYLDCKNGHFFFMATGAFTALFRFSGSLFIMNAPISKLIFPQCGIPNPFTTLSDECFFINVDDFKDYLGIGPVQIRDQNIMMTGIFYGGFVGIPLGAGPAELFVVAGSGGHVFQYSNPNCRDESRIKPGLFLNAKAVGKVPLLAAVCLKINLSVDGEFGSDFSFNDANANFHGATTLDGCVYPSLEYGFAASDRLTLGCNFNFNVRDGMSVTLDGLPIPYPDSPTCTGVCDH